MAKYTISDARKAGFCVEGLRYFSRQHNLDFRDFIQNGIDEQVLIDLGEEGIVRILQDSVEKEMNNG